MIARAVPVADAASDRPQQHRRRGSGRRGGRGPADAPGEPEPEAHRLAADPESIPGDGAPLPPAARAADAARGFSAGNGYLTGLLVNRLA